MSTRHLLGSYETRGIDVFVIDLILVSVSTMAIVLVENEVTEGGRYDHWDDVTGKRYQFPNTYRRRVCVGEVFIYYRGSRRANGKRAVPEYFGHGIIGEVAQDVPNSSATQAKSWTCQIAMFEPFATPVPFKLRGKPLERIARNHWGVGVRSLPERTYKRILTLAGANSPIQKRSEQE